MNKLKVKKEHTITYFNLENNTVDSRMVGIGEIGEIKGDHVMFSDGKSKYIGGNNFISPDEVINLFYDIIEE